MRFTKDGGARVTLHTFKHICSLPLVHRPKGVFLDIIHTYSAQYGPLLCIYVIIIIIILIVFRKYKIVFAR